MDFLLLLQWSAVLVGSIFVLVRGADVFIVGARQLGGALGMSSFAIGVLIVGFGTSLPEFASSLAGALSGATEIVVANTVGSNITNILLIVGLLAFLGGRIVIKQDLLKTELPIFLIATAHFTAAVIDGTVDRLEGLLLTATFGAYLWYIFVESQSEQEDGVPIVKQKLNINSIFLIIIGLAALLVGAKFTVDMVVNIATALSVPVGLISITVVAIGTSLPELFVTLQAVRTKQTEMAIGNIFGSNAFNMLVVVGVPALFVPLVVDPVVTKLGLSIMLVASAFLFVSGLARQIMRWEGLMMLIFFGFFLMKLVAFI